MHYKVPYHKHILVNIPLAWGDTVCLKSSEINRYTIAIFKIPNVNMAFQSFSLNYNWSDVGLYFFSLNICLSDCVELIDSNEWIHFIYK